MTLIPGNMRIITQKHIHHAILVWYLHHQTYSTDDIIKDEVYKVENNQRRKVNITDLGSNHINLRQVYLTALARSRYNLYITNGYFGY